MSPPGATPANDTQPPTITINGANPAHINVGDDYADLGANVKDDHDQNLGIDGTLADVVQLDTSIPGDYKVDYVATDQAGNTATSTRTVIVTIPANVNAIVIALPAAANDNPPPPSAEAI